MVLVNGAEKVKVFSFPATVVDNVLNDDNNVYPDKSIPIVFVLLVSGVEKRQSIFFCI